MKTLILRLLPLVAVSVSAMPNSNSNSIKPTSALSSQTQSSKTAKSPVSLSRFDKKVVQVFNDAGYKNMDVGECYQLVRNIYRKVGRGAIIPPPSVGSVQKLLSTPSAARVSRADFVNLARELRQSSLTGLAVSIVIPPAAMIVASQVPNEMWLSLDLWIVDLVHAFLPTMVLPVINSHGITNKVLLVCLALVLGNAFIGLVNTSLWIGEGKDKTVVVPPSVPKKKIPAEPLEPKLVEPEPHHIQHQHPPPEPIKRGNDIALGIGEESGDSNTALVVAPILLASAMGGVAAFSLDLSRPSSARKTKPVIAAAAVAAVTPPKTNKKVPPPPPTTTTTAETKKAQTKKKKNSKSGEEEDVKPKKDKPPVGRIAAGGAIVGCLQYAATVARFVGVLLP
jgi:hypothetical protein